MFINCFLWKVVVVWAHDLVESVQELDVFSQSLDALNFHYDGLHVGLFFDIQGEKFQLRLKILFL